MSGELEVAYGTAIALGVTSLVLLAALYMSVPTGFPSTVHVWAWGMARRFLTASLAASLIFGGLAGVILVLA